MKPGLAVALVLLALVTASSAQIRGVPPSVTSLGGSKSMAAPPGVPASVTSLGPSGFSTCSNPALIPAALGCTNPVFTPTINFRTGTVEFGRRFNLRPRHRFRNFAGAVYVPYAVPLYPALNYETPVVVDSDEEEEPAARMDDRGSPIERQPDRESDSRYGTHYLDQRERQRREPEPPIAVEEPSTQPAREVIPVVIIFRGGREQEVRNYAIVGDTLYDLGTFVAHKIRLADLDLPATLKANEDRGVEFSLPASYRGQ